MKTKVKFKPREVRMKVTLTYEAYTDHSAVKMKRENA